MIISILNCTIDENVIYIGFKESFLGYYEVVKFGRVIKSIIKAFGQE